MDKKFIVTLEGALNSIEVPVFAASLDDALEIAESTYTDEGLEVTRVRPEVKPQ